MGEVGVEVQAPLARGFSGASQGVCLNCPDSRQSGSWEPRHFATTASWYIRITTIRENVAGGILLEQFVVLDNSFATLPAWLAWSVETS